jgi:hypothetical protein
MFLFRCGGMRYRAANVKDQGEGQAMLTALRTASCQRSPNPRHLADVKQKELWELA